MLVTVSRPPLPPEPPSLAAQLKLSRPAVLLTASRRPLPPEPPSLTAQLELSRPAVLLTASRCRQSLPLWQRSWS